MESRNNFFEFSSILKKLNIVHICTFLKPKLNIFLKIFLIFILGTVCFVRSHFTFLHFTVHENIIVAHKMKYNFWCKSCCS